MSRDDLTPLWKALADPSRRRILDLLRQRPRTTGELSAAFAVSRFAVMKHLRVLEEANLVTVRRQGRQRWNHLNGVPLQQLYERWMRPFEAEWASHLLRLRDQVEASWRIPMPMTPQSDGTLGNLIIEQEIVIQAPRAQVFEALTGDLSPWWGRPYLQDPERAQSVTLEPRLGGRFLERWSEEEGALWCTVTHLKKNERLILQGSMAMGGAVFGVIRFDLEDAPGGTRLQLSHRAIGEVNPELQQGYHAGWTDLLQRRLRAWVERDQRMGLGHEPDMRD